MDKPYGCHLCDIGFSKPNELKSHLDSHENQPAEFRFRCEQCPASFINKQFLILHQASTHTEQDTSSSEQIRSSQEEKAYKCDQCDKSFIRICSLSLCIGFPFKLPHHFQSSKSNHGCDICADIVFLFDDSSSIPVADPHGFHKMKDFMVAVVQSFTNFGPPNGVQVSVVLVAHTVRNYFYLNNFTQEADIVHHMKIFPELKGSATAIGEGLKFVREKSFLPKFGGERLCANKFLVLLTDGKHNLGALPKPQAEALKYDGVTIFVIGVGPKVLMSELLAIASKPEYVFNVTDFDQLATINDRIVDDACNVAKGSKLTKQPCSLKEISKTLIPYGYALVPVFYPLTQKKAPWPPGLLGLDQLTNQHHLPWLAHNEQSHQHDDRIR